MSFKNKRLHINEDVKSFWLNKGLISLNQSYQQELWKTQKKLYGYIGDKRVNLIQLNSRMM